jgi:hypothetical protein
VRTPSPVEDRRILIGCPGEQSPARGGATGAAGAVCAEIEPSDGLRLPTRLKDRLAHLLGSVVTGPSARRNWCVLIGSLRALGAGHRAGVWRATPEPPENVSPRFRRAPGPWSGQASLAAGWLRERSVGGHRSGRTLSIQPPQRPCWLTNGTCLREALTTTCHYTPMARSVKNFLGFFPGNREEPADRTVGQVFNLPRSGKLKTCPTGLSVGPNSQRRDAGHSAAP